MAAERGADRGVRPAGAQGGAPPIDELPSQGWVGKIAINRCQVVGP